MGRYKLQYFNITKNIITKYKLILLDITRYKLKYIKIMDKVDVIICLTKYQTYKQI